MNFSFFPSLIMRTPLYSFENYRFADYGSLLKDSQFKMAIFLASKDFYDELDKNHFDYTLLTAKQKQTIAKYVNRASFRSTPFGLFSSFSLVHWAAVNAAQIIIPKTVQASVLPDFSVLVNMHETWRSSTIPATIKLRPNQSLYLTGTDYRYIKNDPGQDDETTFSVVSVRKSAILKKVLGYCNNGRSAGDIIAFIKKEAAVDEQVASNYINELFGQKVIVSDAEPNVTGQPYVNRLAGDCHTETLGKEVSTLLTPFLQGPGIYQQDADSLAATAKRISNSSMIKNKPKNTFYAVAEREPGPGGLPAAYQEKILEGLNCLKLLGGHAVYDNLAWFASAFENRYGESEVPLLEALDAQFGIGYGNFDEIKDAFAFRKSGYRQTDTKNSIKKERENLTSLLLKEWHSTAEGNKQKEIIITDVHLNQMQVKKTGLQMPPGVSVMFRVLDDNIVIENAGGCSALALMGRFAFSAPVNSLAKQIAAKEQEINKGVVFAEIAHLCSLHAANINCRPHLRNYEIPVLTHSDLDIHHQVQLADLTISVANGNVILRSKRLKKIIIPRLSSAYNFTKNVLPVFRFLCDLQYQNLQADFSFSLQVLSPGLKFYPRVVYKSCILQLAEWYLAVAGLQTIYNSQESIQPNLFRQFAQQNSYPQWFAYTVFDNFLVFNLQSDDDILFFLREVRKKTEVVIREFPFTQPGPADAHDTDGSRYITQYIASLYSTEPAYATENESKTATKKKAVYKDAAKWLYFKIYCHPLSANVILCNHLLPVAHKNDLNNTLQWFWIRYNDPDYHLRFRIKPQAGKMGLIFETLYKLLSKLVLMGLVQRFQTDTYLPELERYGSKQIKLVEAIFKYSSCEAGYFIQKMQKQNLADEDLLIEAAASMQRILNYFSFNRQQQVEFCKLRFEVFYKEFDYPKTLKPEIEQLVKKLYSKITGTGNHTQQEGTTNLMEAAIHTLLQHQGLNKTKEIVAIKLAADIIHMHLNRLFAYQQRYFEMVVYYMVYRLFEVQAHRAKKEQLAF